MRKLIFSIVAMLLVGATDASAFDPRELLKGLGGNSSQDGGSAASGLGSLISNLTSSNKFAIEDLVGTWEYAGPAVSFSSENALQNIGGAAAATAVEDKLEPYYNRLGFNKTTLTVEADSTFSMNMGLLKFKGNIEKPENGDLVFNFTLLNRKVGSVASHATKSGSSLKVTFDSTKMIQMLTKVSSVVNSPSLKALAGVLNSYDGIYMGYKLELKSQGGK